MFLYKIFLRLLISNKVISDWSEVRCNNQSNVFISENAETPEQWTAILMGKKMPIAKHPVQQEMGEGGHL